MTRAGPGVDRLRELGASAATADAFDRQALRDAIAAAAPDVVIDQLTWLPANPADIIKPMPNDTRLHEEGGGNLFPALAQRREGGSREEDRRDKIDVDHGPELRFRDVFQTAGPDAAGVVDEDVKAAEGGKCLFERRGAAFGRRDIGYNAVDFGAPGL
jgi:hypothetical protein